MQREQILTETELRRLIKQVIETNDTNAKNFLGAFYLSASPNEQKYLRTLWYNELGLGGMATGKIKWGSKEWSPFHTQKVLNSIKNFPAGQEIGFATVVEDLALYSKTSPDKIASELLKEYEVFIKEEDIKEKMGVVGYGGGLLGLAFELSSSVVKRIPSHLLRTIGKALQGVGGASLIGKSIYETSRGEALTTSAIDFLLGVGGVYWGFEKKDVISPFFDVEKAYVKFIKNKGKETGRTIITFNERLSEIITEALKQKKVNPLELFVDSISNEQMYFPLLVLNMEKTKLGLANAVQFIDKNPEVVKILRDVNSLLKKLNTRGFESLTEVEKQALYIYDLRNQNKLLSFLALNHKSRDDRYLVRINNQNQITTADSLVENLDEFIIMVRNTPVEIYKLSEKGIEREIGGETYKVVKQITFAPEYKPTWSIPYIIKYKTRDGRIRNLYSNKFELEEDIETLIEEGNEIVAVKGGKTSDIFATRKFSARVETILKEKLAEEDLTNISKEILEDIRSTIDDFFVKGVVYELPKKKGKEAEGYITGKSDEVFAELLKRDLFSKSYGMKIPLVRLREVLKEAEQLSPTAQIYSNLIEELLQGQKEDIISQNFIKRLWLMGNIPVRAINTIAIPFVLGLRGLGNGAKVEVVNNLIIDTLKSILKGLIKTELEELRTEYPFRSFTSQFYSLTRAPFETAIRHIVEQITSKEEYVKAIFPNLPDKVDKEVVKDFLSAFILADTTFAKPNFFLYRIRGDRKVEDVINLLSAFFTSNYATFVSAFKPFATGIGKILFGNAVEKIKGLDTLISAIAISSIYGSLIGMRNVQPFIMMKELGRLTELLTDVFSNDEDFEIQDSLSDPVSRNTILKMISFLTEHFGEITGNKWITNVLVGNGVIGALVGWATRAGSLGVPELLSSPLIEGIMTFHKHLKRMETEMADEKKAIQNMEALLRTAQDLSGFYKRLSYQFFSQISNISRVPSEKSFVQKVYDLFFPRPVYSLEGIPPILSFRDKTTIKRMREQGLDGFHYFFNLKGKIEERDKELGQKIEERVIMAFNDTLNKIKGKGRGKKYLKSVEIKYDEDDEKNLIYLGVLLEELGYRAIEKIPTEILQKHIQYLKEIEKRGKIAKSISY